MSAVLTMTRMELRLFLREPVGWLVVLVLPVALLVGFGLVPGFDRRDEYLGQVGTEYIASLGVGIVLAVLGLSVLPATLGTYREKGVLRRLRATPVSPAVLLVAQLVLALLCTLTAVGLLIGVGTLGLGIAAPRHPAGFALAVLLGAAALLSIGLVIAALTPTGKAANGIGMVVFFPSMFLAGVYVPREAFPPVLRTASDLSPLGATLMAVRAGWNGSWPEPLHLATMAAYALVAGCVAARTFRWE